VERFRGIDWFGSARQWGPQILRQAVDCKTAGCKTVGCKTIDCDALDRKALYRETVDRQAFDRKPFDGEAIKHGRKPHFGAQARGETFDRQAFDGEAFHRFQAGAQAGRAQDERSSHDSA
jgi:hypothetical protein